EKMLHTLSIAANHSSGLLERPASGGGTLKRTNGALAGFSGIRSAFLAGEGITGPETMLEGEHGFCRAFGDLSNLAALTAGLGTDWEILRLHYKIYAQEGYIQPMTEALGLIMKQHRFTPEDVGSIVVGTNSLAHKHVS